MGIIERSIRQPVAVAVVVLMLVIFGVIAVFRVPVQLTPNVDQPTISVTTTWFGSSPQEIEQDIIEEQEDVLKTVSGLREMRSTSTEGQGRIELQFYVGVDKDAALNEVRDKLRQVPDYPLDVDEPIVDSVDSSADNYIAWMIVRPRGGDAAATQPANAKGPRAPEYTGDATKLQTFLEENVKPVLERVEGVAEVNVVGGREREMQVRVDLEKLASRGISIDRFNERLRGENLDVTAGTVVEGKRDVSVRALGRYDSPEEILETVVAYSETGAPVYVRDVAEAEIGFKKQVGFVRSLGQDVVAINAKRETGSNILVVMNGLKAAAERVNAEVLAPRNWGLELFQVYDETIYVNNSLDAATHDLLIGAALATVVLFLTLRSFGATIIVGLSIPISIIGTFLGMYLAGRNLNVISMAGLAFAIGMGVDNTIVVLENIFRHREMGKDRYTAALDGTKEVWGAIVAATLANIAVFLPVAFIQEEAGQLFRDISIAISISLFLYMVVSPTVIPALANLFLRKIPSGLKQQSAVNGENGDSREGNARSAALENRQETRLGRLTAPVQRVQLLISGKFFDLVMWLTGGIMRRLVLIVVMIGVASVASYFLMPPRDYLPSGNQNFVFSVLSPPPGYSLQEFKRMGAQVEATLRPWWEAKPGTPELAELQKTWRTQTNQFAIPAMEQQLAGMKAAMPEEAYEEAAKPVVQQIETLRKLPEPSGIDNYFFVAFGGRVFMGATSNDPTGAASVAALLSGSLQGIPGTFGFAQQVPIFNLGRIGGATVDLNVVGNDYDKVRASAGMLQGALMGAFKSFVQSDPNNFSIGRAETQVRPDRARAAAAGVTTPAIREATQVAVDGAIIGDYRDSGDVIDLTVMSTDRYERTSDSLAHVPLATRAAAAFSGATGIGGGGTGGGGAGGGDSGAATTDGGSMVVPLSAVATLVDTSAAQQINRLEREPSVTLSVQVPTGMTVDEATGIINGVVGDLRKGGMVPQEVRTATTGSADKLQKFTDTFVPDFTSLKTLFAPESGVPFGVVGLAALITYLLLAALFESFLHPFVIIMSVPFALVGGFLGLRILHETSGTNMDVLTMLGFVILIGTIVNNPILIVHQALNYIRDEGMGRQRAIALSTQTRVRPIFMSVITSVAGMAPLVVFGGAGSELYRGLGAVVIGGLLVSTFFTLFLTPALMSLMLDGQTWVHDRFTSKGRGTGGSGDGTPPDGSRRARPVTPPSAVEEEVVVARSTAAPRVDPA